MLQFVDELRLSFWERNQLQLDLSRWVGSLGKNIYDNYLKSRETFCLAEAILGLSLVESLKA